MLVINTPLVALFRGVILHTPIVIAGEIKASLLAINNMRWKYLIMRNLIAVLVGYVFVYSTYSKPVATGPNIFFIMHNIAEADVFRPAVWNPFGTDRREGGGALQSF